MTVLHSGQIYRALATMANHRNMHRPLLGNQEDIRHINDKKTTSTTSHSLYTYTVIHVWQGFMHHISAWFIRGYGWLLYGLYWRTLTLHVYKTF